MISALSLFDVLEMGVPGNEILNYVTLFRCFLLRMEFELCRVYLPGMMTFSTFSFKQLRALAFFIVLSHIFFCAY